MKGSKAEQILRKDKRYERIIKIRNRHEETGKDRRGLRRIRKRMGKKEKKRRKRKLKISKEK